MVQKFRTRSSQLYDNFIDYALHLTDGWQLNLRHVLRLYYSFNTPNPLLPASPSANNVAAFQAYIFYSNNLKRRMVEGGLQLMPEWPKPLSMMMMMMNNMYLLAWAAGRVHGQAKSRTGLWGTFTDGEWRDCKAGRLHRCRTCRSYISYFASDLTISFMLSPLPFPSLSLLLTCSIRCIRLAILAAAVIWIGFSLFHSFGFDFHFQFDFSFGFGFGLSSTFGCNLQQKGTRIFTCSELEMMWTDRWGECVREIERGAVTKGETSESVT